MTHPIRFVAPLVRRAFAIAFAFVATVAAPAAAYAQDDTRSTVVSFASASARANGYLHGQVRISYKFRSCGDRPQLFYTLEAGSAQGYEGYWFEGKFYGLKAEWRAPVAPKLDAELRVTFAARPIHTSRLVDPYVSVADCGGGPQYRMLGQWSELLTGTMTRVQAIPRFALDIGQAREPMRNLDIEAKIRDELRAVAAKARSDSLARIAKARTDSVARAGATVRSGGAGATTAATTRPATRAATGAATGAAAGAAATARAASSATTTPTAAAPTTADREAAARAAAAADQRDADFRARAVVAQIEAQQEANARRDSSTDAAAEGVAGMVGAIFEERRIAAAKRAAAEARAAENYAAYQTRMAARFAALPPRPACTAADTGRAITIGESRAGQLIGSECRLADGTSAVQVPLRIDVRRKVRIDAQTSVFYPKLALRRSGSATALLAGERTMEEFLEPGSYVVTMNTRHAGELGAYTLEAKKGMLSRTTSWSVGIFMGPISGDFTGVAEEPDFGTVGGLRGGLALSERLHLVGEGIYANGYTWLVQAEGGLRYFLLDRTSNIRPWVQATYGWREMFADRSFTGNFYSGMGSTLSVGGEYFLSPGMSLEASLGLGMGELEIDDPTTGVSPTIDFGHTAFRIGMMLRR